MVTQEVELPVTPTALLTRCVAEPYVFLLDGGSLASWGSGHALFAFRPRATLRVTAAGDAVVRADDTMSRCSGDPLVLLERFRSAWAPRVSAAPAPFAGGVVAALSYDLGRWIERRRWRTPTDADAPVVHAACYDWLLSYSYRHRRYQLASEACSRAQLERIAAKLRALADAPAPLAQPPSRAVVVPDFTREQFCAAVRAVLDYIAAGDVYQVNLAQRFVVNNPPSPAAMFAALQSHPMPFAAYVDGGDFALLSNSPECLLTLHGDRVATFPVKGTRRRATDPRVDELLVKELQTDAKERAEHVMIVDLERNDLGRICRTGSVEVEAFAGVSTFPSLHHLVSTVSGRLRPGTSVVDILRATFPGGSITGAPKIRAMEIIDEIEPVTRGFYTGAIGFMSAAQAVFNLTIRTALATAQGLTYHAGGGIVADSVPELEYEETLLKAAPFFAALTAEAA